MKVTEDIINKAILTVVIGMTIAITGIIFYFLSLRLGSIAKENQTYNRYTSCVLSVPAGSRDQKKIDHCWTESQEDTGIQVKRY